MTPAAEPKGWSKAWPVIRGVAIALLISFALLGVVGFIGLLSLRGMFKDPPRKLTVPIVRGMTVAEVGNARPTEYELEKPPIGEQAAASQDLKAFSGWMWATDRKGDTSAIAFEHGKCSDDRSPSNESRAVYDRVPVGTTVAQALRKLGKEYEVEFRPDSLWYELPQEASKLKRFNGTLVGHESTGWTFYAWHVTFRNGIVTDVKESVTYD